MMEQQIETQISKPLFSPRVIRWYKSGWETYKAHWKILILAELVSALFSFPYVMRYHTKGLWLIFWGLLDLFSPWITIILITGHCYLCLHAVRNQNPRIADLFAPFKRFFTVLLTDILYFLIMIGGFILLIIPGVVWGIKYGEYFYAVMDKPFTARQSISYSGKITQGYNGIYSW